MMNEAICHFQTPNAWRDGCPRAAAFADSVNSLLATYIENKGAKDGIDIAAGLIGAAKRLSRRRWHGTRRHW